MNFAHHDFELDERGPGAGSSFSSAMANQQIVERSSSGGRDVCFKRTPKWSPSITRVLPGLCSRPSPSRCPAPLSRAPRGSPRVASPRPRPRRRRSRGSPPARVSADRRSSRPPRSSVPDYAGRLAPARRSPARRARCSSWPRGRRARSATPPRAPRARAPRPGAVARGGRVAREGAAGAAARPARGRDLGPAPPPGRLRPPRARPPRRAERRGVRAAPPRPRRGRRRRVRHRRRLARAVGRRGDARARSLRDGRSDPRGGLPRARARARDPRGAIDPPEEPRDPDRVHHLAMRRLEHHAGLREVLGAPITSPSPRACAFVGGEWTRAERLQSPSSPNDPSSPEPGTLLRRLLGPLAAWVPRGYAWMPHAVHLAFPVVGARHRGVVVASARKTRGRHEMDLLVVDVRARDGHRHRVFLVSAPPTPSARRVPGSSSEDDSEDASSVETSSESVSVHAAAPRGAGGGGRRRVREERRGRRRRDGDRRRRRRRRGWRRGGRSRWISGGGCGRANGSSTACRD